MTSVEKTTNHASLAFERDLALKATQNKHKNKNAGIKVQCPTKKLKFDYDTQISQHIMSKEPVPKTLRHSRKRF